MEVLMIGNGFDLSCNLPTTYLCFLWSVSCIVNFVTKHGGLGLISYLPEISIYDVLSNIQGICPEAKNSLDAYEEVYKKVIIQKESIWKFAKICEENCWWHYFYHKGFMNINWID